MPSDSTELLNRWQAGDEQAANELYQRYVGRLAGLVSNHLAARFQQRIDPEDVLQSAYGTFFRRAGEGQFRFDDDGDVWKLLVSITLNKTRLAVRRHSAGARNVRNEVADSTGGASAGEQMEMISQGPRADELLAAADLVTHLCERLGDRHGHVLQLRLDGCSRQDVAEQLGVNERTVRRMLDQIRAELSRASEQE